MSGNKLRINFKKTGGELAWITFTWIVLSVMTCGLAFWVHIAIVLVAEMVIGLWFLLQLIEFQTDNLEITSDYVVTLEGAMFASSNPAGRKK